ncbi:GNAT family N-acetyltransferase [Methyloceanibacter sp.]|uniref:GNAT family N-acetyltransferase n=1 Tax=Methyloceanibacter sp. TaxID=1965321 RepID=UPI002C32A4CC|nr:GNAT family N-acetyltransferase [Methyloceanibacter sp.]HML92595.1 GNAT family N-acetyltransferase [Methyloceanibacter sp.]
MSDLDIIPYAPDFRRQAVRLAIAAWKPVFAKTQNEVPHFVFDAFYPEGWEARQIAEVESLLDTEPETVWLAAQENTVAGFVGIRIHPEDQMGEIHILAVSPDRQRQGVARKLAAFAENEIRERGMKMVMVETVGDTGHEPARRAYEAFGYRQWPVARYFKPL